MRSCHFEDIMITEDDYRLQGMITEGRVQTLGCVTYDVTVKCQVTLMVLRYVVAVT